MLFVVMHVVCCFNAFEHIMPSISFLYRTEPSWTGRSIFLCVSRCRFDAPLDNQLLKDVVYNLQIPDVERCDEVEMGDKTFV